MAAACAVVHRVRSEEWKAVLVVAGVGVACGSGVGRSVGAVHLVVTRNHGGLQLLINSKSRTI